MSNCLLLNKLEHIFLIHKKVPEWTNNGFVIQRIFTVAKVSLLKLA